MAESCSNCRFFRPSRVIVGCTECHRNPPSVFTPARGSTFPLVEACEWCGQFEAVQVAETSPSSHGTLSQLVDDCREMIVHSLVLYDHRGAACTEKMSKELLPFLRDLAGKALALGERSR